MPEHRYRRPGGRRVLFFFLGIVGSLVLLPVAGALVITAAFAGRTSVAVAAILSAAVIAVVMLTGRFLLGRLRPVRELIDTTSRLADGEYSARVTNEGRGSMVPVIHSFNDMAARLERSDDLRRRLLADLGHELRTPLTIIRGQIEAMADGVRALDENELRGILDDVDTMERLLDDLRLLSAAEAGMVELERDEVDLRLLAEQVAARFQATAVEAGVELTVGGDLDVTATVDPHRIGQVVTNLVANALKAVSAGDQVNVKVTESGEEATIEVADTGVGVAVDQIDAVFDRFHKGSGSTGSGLGLTISRDLVEAHGGTIQLESEAGTGTSVVVTLPTAPQPR